MQYSKGRVMPCEPTLYLEKQLRGRKVRWYSSAAIKQNFISEKFKHTGNRYNIRMIFNTKHTLRSSNMKTRPEKESCNRWHSASTVFPVNVAEATLKKQKDL
jgi:hypothetical protein